MTKTDIQKFVGNSLDLIQFSLPKGFRIHRIKFSVIDEEAQKKSWNQDKKILGELFQNLSDLDPEWIKIENKGDETHE